MMGHGYGWGMGAGGWIEMTVFWVALITLVVWLVARALPDGQDRRDTRSDDVAGTLSAEQVLDHRYAAGELDLDTYQAMRTHLASARRSGPGAG